MAQAALRNYLRTYRRKAGFSQDELAYLLGCADGAKVSRYERLTRQPSTETVLAYRAVFGASVTKLFRGLYEKVETDTRHRAQELLQQLVAKGEIDPFDAQKIAILEQFVEPMPQTHNHEH